MRNILYHITVSARADMLTAYIETIMNVVYKSLRIVDAAYMHNYMTMYILDNNCDKQIRNSLQP